MRVMFVVPDLRIGGAERHVVTLLPRMDPVRFEVSVVCVGEEGALFGELQTAGISARALHLGGRKNALRAFRELISVFRRTQPDVVVLRGFNAEFLGRIAARAAGVKHSIVWVHGIDFAQRSPVRNMTDRLLVRWTSKYFGVSDVQRSYIADWIKCPPHKMAIIHNGVEPRLFEPQADRSALAEFGLEATAEVVGIVAALRPEKDHVTFLEAARILLGDRPTVVFLIVGDGPNRADLQMRCAEMGLEPNVHFLGARSDISRLLRAIDVLALSSEKEAFPMSVLEAMACCLPVVCTDVGGVGEMVTDGVTGFLVPTRDPQQLAARLADLLSNPELAHRMGSAGRLRVESEFSLEQSVAATERALMDVVHCR